MHHIDSFKYTLKRRITWGRGNILQQDQSFVAIALSRSRYLGLALPYLAPPSNIVCVPVIWAEAGEAKNNAIPAASSGFPRRPVGWFALKTSSPAVRSPKAVILLGKTLEQKQVGEYFNQIPINEWCTLEELRSLWLEIDQQDGRLWESGAMYVINWGPSLTARADVRWFTGEQAFFWILILNLKEDSPAALLGWSKVDYEQRFCKW